MQYFLKKISKNIYHNFVLILFFIRKWLIYQFLISWKELPGLIYNLLWFITPIWNRLRWLMRILGLKLWWSIIRLLRRKLTNILNLPTIWNINTVKLLKIQLKCTMPEGKQGQANLSLRDSLIILQEGYISLALLKRKLVRKNMVCLAQA